MRIIAGKYQGRRLAKVPKPIRPSTDRLRETLFNILGESVKGRVWLDLFAGSGAVGIEALSRGAQRVILNDRNSEALKVIRKNLDLCQVEGGFEVYQMDVFVLLKKLSAPCLDFIFLDPPYQFKRLEKLLAAVARLDSLHPESCIILETFKKTKNDFVGDSLVVARVLQLGDSRLFLLEPRT